METRTILLPPVALPDLKSNLRLTTDAFDEDLLLKLEAAVEECEAVTGVALVPANYRLECAFQSVKALRWPLVSLTSVKVDGALVPSTEYTVDKDLSVLVMNESVKGGRMEVVYRAGTSAMPRKAEMAAILIASDLFDNPTNAVRERGQQSDVLLRSLVLEGRARKEDVEQKYGSI